MLVSVTVQELAEMVCEKPPGPVTTHEVCIFLMFVTLRVNLPTPDFTRAGVAAMVPVFVPEQAPPMVSDGGVQEPPAPLQVSV